MDEKALKTAAKKYKHLITPPYNQMMEMDGFEAICALSKAYSGTSVYIPSLRTIFGRCLDTDMLEQYARTNVRELVQKYGYSERYVRDLVKGGRYYKRYAQGRIPYKQRK